MISTSYSLLSLGGPYASFAGHDASRGLAKNSFDDDMMVDPKGPIDKLEDLTSDEWESLREWVRHRITISTREAIDRYVYMIGESICFQVSVSWKTGRE